MIARRMIRSKITMTATIITIIHLFSTMIRKLSELSIWAPLSLDGTTMTAGVVSGVVSTGVKSGVSNTVSNAVSNGVENGVS